MTLTSRTGVAVAALLTTLVAIALAELLVYVIYPLEVRRIVLLYTPLVTSLAGYPLCWLVWWQVSRAQRMGIELQRLLDRDRLTDAATRDYFFSTLGDGHAGVLLMVDIDHFKSVNDTWGHGAGDAVIRHVATILRMSCRTDDVVCRFGGEEFAVFLRNADVTRGDRVADRMLTAVATGGVDPQARAGQDPPGDGVAIRITVSIGGAVKPAGSDLASALREADDALYLAKRAGRNRFVPTWMVRAA